MEIQAYPDELDYVNAQLHPSIRRADDKSFLGTFCQACLRADGENYEILRPALYFFSKKYPADPERLLMERMDRGIEDPPQSSQEDARGIAGELLEALKNASQELHRWPDMQGPMLQRIDAAIAKAEG